MGIVFSYRGRPVDQADLTGIRRLIAEHPEASRRKLSMLLCEAWGWRQANGSLKDMVCRGLMLGLHRAGHIQLPPVRMIMKNPLANRVRPARISGIDDRPITGRLGDLPALAIRQVRRREEESFFNGLVESFHYLGYTQPVGEHLKYMVWSGDRPVACLAWCSAVRHLGARDRFIGWDQEARRRNIHLLAYNTRYLILPWIRVPHLASHLLGRIAGRISRDWQDLYHHPILFLETFIDPERYPGTCYRAANWVSMGLTTGRGKNDQTMKANRPIKEVLGLPLNRRFRELLSA